MRTNKFVALALVLAFTLTLFAGVVPAGAQSGDAVAKVYPDQYYQPEQAPYVRVFTFDDPRFNTPAVSLPNFVIPGYGPAKAILVGRPVDISQPEWKPFVDANGRTQFPIRFVAESLGYQVDWSDKEQKVTLSKNGHTVVMTIGSKAYTVDGVTKYMDTEPFLQADRTFVPLRFVAEGLGYVVTWHRTHNFVYIGPKA
ncbi:copper amine oxidase N-terminal domain-containing protein [Neomoorella thermoacetica]|uniref:copper amine oxidase N-terminal domain-containing protein n=1 Tax=Neomoorella thermoacetica TaxID=1525 RepID=UPI0030CD258A